MSGLTSYTSMLVDEQPLPNISLGSNSTPLRAELAFLLVLTAINLLIHTSCELMIII